MHAALRPARGRRRPQFLGLLIPQTNSTGGWYPLTGPWLMLPSKNRPSQVGKGWTVFHALAGNEAGAFPRAAVPS
jgi:hypothetical protein